MEKSVFFSPGGLCGGICVFVLLCNQPIFPTLSGNAPAGNLEKVVDAKEKKQSQKEKNDKEDKTKGTAGW